MRWNTYLSCKLLSFFTSDDFSGDSYSSTAYNVKGDHPREENPLGNPPYPGLTYSGGPNWVTNVFIHALTVNRLVS